jgi:uncharacterized protein (DUF433 family)
MEAVASPHVEVTPEGVPMIAGTSTKVVEIALDRLAYHLDADEIRRQHPTLTLGQIYGALAYYSDHQEETDRDIAARLSRADAILAGLGESPLRARLKTTKASRNAP